MKIKITKVNGQYADQSDVGSVHLIGHTDTTACGMLDELYDSKNTNEKLTCSACKRILAWAKKAAKVKE